MEFYLQLKFENKDHPRLPLDMCRKLNTNLTKQQTRRTA